MCGRYSLFTPKEKVEERLQATAVEWENWQARYNAAPTQPMPVITNEFPGIIQYMRWGLVPKWAKDMQVGSKMINTRSESIREKPSFFNIFKYKRCLVLADGYYEWKVGIDAKSARQPYRFHLPDNELMLMAGLWDTWQNGLQTFSIITCPANADIAPIHHRMPVLLTQKSATAWLSNESSTDELLHLLLPAPKGLVQRYPIYPLLNRAGYDHPDVITPMPSLL
ncbi:MAG: SOS response-associated peptidase [Bacteroidetes bacterium]|jgi:Uncharacterized conserved protein|uniref:SOS response-associated peptidase n=1 Tax=Phnomibacter sp. TaxID=2836217 RepID=UPI002FDE79FF|nr:SOS response-associated peptidase [Bacteroidota bacterium]